MQHYHGPAREGITSGACSRPAWGVGNTGSWTVRSGHHRQGRPKQAGVCTTYSKDLGAGTTSVNSDPAAALRLGDRALQAGLGLRAISLIPLH